MFNTNYFSNYYFEQYYFYSGSEAFTVIDYVRLFNTKSRVAYMKTIKAKVATTTASSRINYKGT